MAIVAFGALASPPRSTPRAVRAVLGASAAAVVVLEYGRVLPGQARADFRESAGSKRVISRRTRGKSSATAAIHVDPRHASRCWNMPC